MAIPRRLQYLDDGEVVHIAQMGSLEACDELVRRFRGAVTLVAGQTLGAGGAAEDVAQESFLLAFRALPQLHDPAKFAGWLYTITRHRAQRVATGERRSAPTEPSEMERLLTAREASAPDPGEAFAWAETSAEIHTGLEALPEEHRIVLQLYYVEEWPAPRIADFLSLPLTTVRWRLHSGLKRLRHRLSELFEETEDGQRSTTRSAPPAKAAGADDGTGRPCRADRKLQERSERLAAPV